MGNKTHWYEIKPEDALDIQLPHDDIQGPLTSTGEECPWPWEPQQLVGTPMGQYHCPYCGEMVVAGIAHVDYKQSGEVWKCERGETPAGPDYCIPCSELLEDWVPWKGHQGLVKQVSFLRRRVAELSERINREAMEESPEELN